MEVLKGGRKEGIHRIDDKVYRPSGYWSISIHILFDYLQSVQFDYVPKSFGFADNGNQILSYVSGDVYNYPLVDAIATEDALCSAAVLLRRYHDATVNFIKSEQCQVLEWMLPTREPQQVLCHGDFAPYNVALNGNDVVGIFDFDTAHPAPRIWDIAYAVYCWAPFKTNVNDALGNLTEQSSRAKLFCDCYELPNDQRLLLVDVMISRIQTLIDFMQEEASKGNEAFIANMKDNHHLSYREDIKYLQYNKVIICDALLSVSC